MFILIEKLCMIVTNMNGTFCPNPLKFWPKPLTLSAS